MRAVHVRGRRFNGRQLSGLNSQYFDCGMSLLGSGVGGLMCGIKITSARLCAKNAGWAYARGGVYLRDTTVCNVM